MAGKISIIIVIWVLGMSATINALGAAGLWAWWGVEEPTLGAEDEVENVKSESRRVEQGGLGGSTLVGLFLAVLTFAKNTIVIIPKLPGMFVNLGVPGFLVNPFTAVLIFVMAVDILAAGSGRDLI